MQKQAAERASPLPFGFNRVPDLNFLVAAILNSEVSIAFRRSNRCNMLNAEGTTQAGLSPLPFGVPTAATASSAARFICQ